MNWEVRTTAGTLVWKGYDSNGLTEKVAKDSAVERNERAEAAGLRVRYEARKRVLA